MFNIFFKTTIRNLWKNKTYNFLNIFGLAIGIACASLIFLWVEDELTFNHIFEKRDNLYRVMENHNNDAGKVSTSGVTRAPVAASIKKEIPGIKNTVRFSWEMNQLFVLGDKSINENGVYVDSTILSMLNIRFIHGDITGALNQMNSVVISETMSKKFFGNIDPVGKFLQANSHYPFAVDGAFIVTGVFKDLPKNSTYQVHWLSPFEIFSNKNVATKTWADNSYETLVELEPSVNPASVNKKLENYLSTKMKGSSIQCFLFSMNDWHLYDHFTDGKQDGGNIKYVKLFSLIAAMILLIACINFMNLATARSEQRAKEVGVRKVLGSNRNKLIRQFIGESLIMSFLAVVMAVSILYLVIPSYNLLVQKDLSGNIFQPHYLGGLIAIGLISGLIAGSYPAFYLSSFHPIIVLKGLKIKSSIGAILMRKGLVIAQFTTSIVLIICTTIIYQQVQYVKHRDLGFKKDNLVWTRVQGKLKDHFSTIRDELIKSGVVKNAALAPDQPLHVGMSSEKYSWQGKASDNRTLIDENDVTTEYVPTMQMKLISGRNFYSTPRVDENSVIINESMAKVMGTAGRIGSVIHDGQWEEFDWGKSVNLTVVGIVKDFVYNDMYKSGMPSILRCINLAPGAMLMSLTAGIDTRTALAKIENIIKVNNPGFPFEYFFLDDEFNKMFSTETLIEKLAGVFAVLAIFISCLGLFGLAAYTAQRRTKEIGIRKVLGASTPEMAGLLSKDFLKLVIISCVVAFPIALWAMNNWLQEYQYRTTIQWWVFPCAGLTALLIALVTVSYQAIKAAIANPVKSLRTE
ncbi:MAG: ABC transporter permease [Ferruginibacter sp.]